MILGFKDIYSAVFYGVYGKSQGGFIRWGMGDSKSGGCYLLPSFKMSDYNS